MNLISKRFDEISQRTPMIANIRPSGEFLMEDFYYAGGLRALLETDTCICSILRLSDGLGKDAWKRTFQVARVHKTEVIRSLDDPVSRSGGTAVLYGNLAPTGRRHQTNRRRVLDLLSITGRAVVFKDYNDLAARIDDEHLEVDENSVLVLQNAGPLGGPGMPEWGMLPIPRKLLKRGVRDMVRISDARMSGTSYGACVLHISPESFIGGPLALVKDGDLIELNVEERRLQLMVNEEEMARRKQEWIPPRDRYERGFGALYSQHVTASRRRLRLRFLSEARNKSGTRNPLGKWVEFKPSACGIVANIPPEGGTTWPISRSSRF